MNVNETNEVLERAQARAEKGEGQVSHTPALDAAANNRRSGHQGAGWYTTGVNK